MITPSTELVERPLDQPIVCSLEQCPSLAVSPQGTLVAYDQASKTLTWFDAEPHVVHVSADLGAGHVELKVLSPDGFGYLVAGSPATESWDLVEISPAGKEMRRTASPSPEIEPWAEGLSGSCWSGCEPATRLLMGWQEDDVLLPSPYPDVVYSAGSLTVRFGGHQWAIAVPDPLSTRPLVASRWDGGAVLSVVPDSADAPTELIELLPGGQVQRFGVGEEAVHALLPDGSAVVWRDGQLVRLSPPQPAEAPAAWSPELTAQPVEPPIACDRAAGIRPSCPALVVSPDGTLVGLDAKAETVIWYEDQPRVVPLTADFPAISTSISTSWRSGRTMLPTSWSRVPRRTSWPSLPPVPGSRGMDVPRGGSPYKPTAAGLVENGWTSPDAALVMAWVDLDGSPITDTRPYPTATLTAGGMEVRLGDRQWQVPRTTWFHAGATVQAVRSRSDGGVVILLEGSLDEDYGLLELLPDGTIEHYLIASTPSAPGPALLADGSLIVEHNFQLVRLTPPA